MAAAKTEIIIKFDARERRMLVRLLERLDTLIAILIEDETDATQEQDSGVPSGPPESD